MPTHEEIPGFLLEFQGLSPAQREAFLDALREFVADLQAWETAGCKGAPQFRGRLRVKSVAGYPGVWEITWDYHDGRATFAYGKPKVLGKAHVVWRRVGSHSIFREP